MNLLGYVCHQLIIPYWRYKGRLVSGIIFVRKRNGVIMNPHVFRYFAVYVLIAKWLLLKRSQ